MSYYIQYIKHLIIIGLLYIDINSCCKEKKKPNQEQSYSADIKKPIITPPGEFKKKINNPKTKTDTKKDNIKGEKVDTEVNPPEKINTKVSPTEKNSKVNEKEKIKPEVSTTEEVNPKEEGKPQINIKIDESKGITMNKIENISSCKYPPINNNFYDVTTVYETNIKGIQTKEQVKNLNITIEYPGYESKPYLLALVYDGEKNYIIFCEDANTKYISYINIGLFRQTNIESITICNSNNLENACGLFYHCECLKQLDIINFNTQKLRNISFMFALCYRLKNINDLKNINFDIVTDASRMFLKSSIEEIEINLGPKINNLFSMFEECDNLKKIKINNFIFTNKNGEKIDIRNIILKSCGIDTIEINTDSDESRKLFLKKIGKEKFMLYDKDNKLFLNKNKFLDTKNYKYDEVNKVFKKIEKTKKLK